MRVEMFFKLGITGTQKTVLIYCILLTMIGQLAAFLYLPSLPAISQSFHSSKIIVQYSAILFIMSYGISLLIYGPISDNYDRKYVVLLGLLIFMVGTVICILSKTAKVFLIGRVIEGFGIGHSSPLSRAIVHDILDKGNLFIKTMSIMTMTAGIVPLLSPVIGGYLQDQLGWQANFLTILIFSFAVFFLWAFHMPDINLKNSKKKGLNSYLINYIRIIKNKKFLCYLLTFTTIFSGEVTYNILSPFVIINQLHYSATIYGLISLFLVIAFILGALFSFFLLKVTSHDVLISIGQISATIAVILLLILNLKLMTLLSIIIPMCFYTFGAGLIYSNSVAGATILYKNDIGTVSSSISGLQMLLAFSLSSLLIHICHFDFKILSFMLFILITISFISHFIIYKYYRN